MEAVKHIDASVLPWIRFTAGLSCAMSFIILLTGYIFYKEMVKSKIYMKLILMINVCDFMACSWMAVGYPSNETVCKIQG